MGRCRKCGNETRYKYPLCWKHYYFDISSGRFWASLLITIILEYFINFPIITEEGIIVIILKSLFDATNFIWFIIGASIIEAIVFISSLMFINYLVYKYVYSKHAIIKLKK